MVLPIRKYSKSKRSSDDGISIDEQSRLLYKPTSLLLKSGIPHDTDIPIDIYIIIRMSNWMIKIKNKGQNKLMMLQ
jgi:hypothetical protein